MPHTRYTTLISADSLAQRLAQTPADTIIFDCRFDLADPDAGLDAYSVAHIDGSHYLHLDHDLSGPRTGSNGRHPLPDRHGLAHTLAACGLNRDMQVVAYDAQGGIYAARLWWLLRWLGHEAVAVLDGGLQAWIAAGHAVVVDPTLPQHATGNFVAGKPLATAVGVSEIEQNLQTRAELVIDARAPDRYRGENETLDPRGGHIPGALNRFFKDNLTGEGRFKPGHVLRDEFSAVIGAHPVERVVLQCGSGVTACHNALAMELAGLHGAALYGGSWSEWSADPARPIATGATP
jgi:thiosulfate/3-mercaptopyruvate sulfurtransferase